MTDTSIARAPAPKRSVAPEQHHRRLSPGVRPVTVDANGITLSGLLSEPSHGSPRAVIIALHGGGMNAGYFDGQAHPDVSLLSLGARLGYTVLALDRPGYGASAVHLPRGQRLMAQAATVRAAAEAFTARLTPGAGTFVLAHSFGAKVALAAATGWDASDLLGVDVSGCGGRPAISTALVGRDGGMGRRRLNWGPLNLYPPDTFRLAQTVVAPMPTLEAGTVAGWARLSAAILPRIRVPVRLTFAQHEAWWSHDDDDLADLTARLSSAPRVITDRLPHAGHNISLGWAARAYHLKALAFAEECLSSTENGTPSSRAT